MAAFAAEREDTITEISSEEETETEDDAGFLEESEASGTEEASSVESGEMAEDSIVEENLSTDEDAPGLDETEPGADLDAEDESDEDLQHGTEPEAGPLQGGAETGFPEEDSAQEGQKAGSFQEDLAAGSLEADLEADYLKGGAEADSLQEEKPGEDAGAVTEEETGLVASDEMEEVKADAANYLIDPSESDFADASEINAGDSVYVSVEDVFAPAFFKFVPEEDGLYAFYSYDNGDCDPVAGLYDSDGGEITLSDDDDISSNFRIEELLEGGETYYFQACCGGDGTGSYMVRLEKNTSWLLAVIVGEPERWVEPDSEVTLEVSASSSSQITYQWFGKNDEEIPDANTESYTFIVTEGTTGAYRCLISDEDGHIEMIDFFIYVENSLTAYAEGTEDTVFDLDIVPNARADLSVTVSAKDESELSCQWYKYGYDQERDEWDYLPIEGATGKTFSIASVTEYAAYRFQVRDQYENISSVIFYISVNHLQAYVEGTEDTETDLYLAPKARADLSVEVFADEMDGLSFQWYKDEEEIEGATGTTCTIASVTEDAEYQFKVHDQYGNDSTVYFYVYVETMIDADSVTLSRTSYTYNGKAKKPSVTVKCGETTLKSGRDYTVAYSANTNAGKAKVTVTAKGDYSGTVTKAFTITKAGQTITGPKATYQKTYGNKAFSLGAKAKTKLTYKSSNSKIAVVSTKGIVTIKGAGTATITITAASDGNYKKATKKVTVKVKKAASTIKAKTTKKTIKLADANKKAQTFNPGISVNSKGALTCTISSVQFGKKSLTAKDYKKIFSVNSSKGIITIKKNTVIKKGTYTLKMKITSKATAKYKAATKTATFTITVK